MSLKATDQLNFLTISQFFRFSSNFELFSSPRHAYQRRRTPRMPFTTPSYMTDGFRHLFGTPVAPFYGILTHKSKRRRAYRQKAEFSRNFTIFAIFKLFWEQYFDFEKAPGAFKRLSRPLRRLCFVLKLEEASEASWRLVKKLTSKKRLCSQPITKMSHFKARTRIFEVFLTKIQA